MRTSTVLTSFDITSQTFIVPSLTTLSGPTLNVTVATLPIRTCKEVSVQLAAPFPQQGTLAPRMKDVGIDVTQPTGILDGYALCSGSILLEEVTTGLVTVRAMVQQQAVDAYLVDGGEAG